MSVRHLVNAWCPKCQSDTLHQRMICLTCKSDNKEPNMRDAITRIAMRYEKAYGKVEGANRLGKRIAQCYGINYQARKESGEADFRSYLAESAKRKRR